MWRNTDVDAFIRWLRGHNAGPRLRARCAGFYGLDLYNLSGSMQAVIDFLDEEDPELARLAHRRYGCLEPWADNPQLYGRHSLLEGYARCEVGVVQMLKDLLQRQVDCFAGECDDWLDAAANARLVKNAEAYYRVMYHGSAESWNLRDTHMFETLNMILDAKGPNSKAIVWAHNSHIGNAAFTDMGMHRDELNIGQLAKEKFGDEARLIGFGTHSGTVAAADDWDEPMKIKRVHPSLPESHERMSHESGHSALPARPARRRGRASRCDRADGAAARAVHRRHLPAGDRALEPLQRGDPAQAVRRLGVVRRDRARSPRCRRAACPASLTSSAAKTKPIRSACKGGRGDGRRRTRDPRARGDVDVGEQGRRPCQPCSTS